MAVGTVLAKHWGQPAHPLVSTSWQLVAGGPTDIENGTSC